MQAIEKRNRRYLVIKGGGLAWLLRQGGVVVDVVEHGGSLGVYQKEVKEGERNK